MNSLRFNTDKENLHAVHRLTALWALNESGLGGIMHALQIPFTGFFVGGIAVILIGLIAHYSNCSYRQIVQATLSVIIVKAIVSPQSPFAAYIAVAFQGFIGGLLYSLIPNYKLASLIFGLLALLESALQKFLVTTIVFGKSVWEALDIFFNGIVKDLSFSPLSFGEGRREVFSFSFWLIAIYCIVYALWGLILGWWISKLLRQIESRSEEIKIQYNEISIDYKLKPELTRNSRKRSLLYILYILLFIITVFTLSNTENNSNALYIVLRTAAVLLGWFVFVQPILKFLIKRYARKNKEKKIFRVEELIASLPSLKKIAQQAYHLSSKSHKGFARYREFIFILIVITLHSDAIEK